MDFQKREVEEQLAKLRKAQKRQVWTKCLCTESFLLPSSAKPRNGRYGAEGLGF